MFRGNKSSQDVFGTSKLYPADKKPFSALKTLTVSHRRHTAVECW